MNPQIKSKCIGLRKEFIQVVLLWDQKTNAMEKKKPKQDGQLNSSAGIQTEPSHNPELKLYNSSIKNKRITLEETIIKL